MSFLLATPKVLLNAKIGAFRTYSTAILKLAWYYSLVAQILHPVMLFRILL
jgi:hypothetical protein